MRLETRKYLYDNQHAGALLKQFNAGKTSRIEGLTPGSTVD